MFKLKKRILLVGLLFVIIVAGLLAINNYKTASADTMPNDEMVEVTEDGSERLLTTLNLGIGAKNGMVYANVTNKFTLGFSTVRVYIELYSSYTYQEAYTSMTLESRNYIEDLDIGKSIETSVSTGGETKYWMARMRYRVNSGDWEEKVTSLWHIDGNGNKID